MQIHRALFLCPAPTDAECNLHQVPAAGGGIFAKTALQASGGTNPPSRASVAPFLPEKASPRYFPVAVPHASRAGPKGLSTTPRYHKPSTPYGQNHRGHRLPSQEHNRAKATPNRTAPALMRVSALVKAIRAAVIWRDPASGIADSVLGDTPHHCEKSLAKMAGLIHFAAILVPHASGSARRLSIQFAGRITP